LVRLSGDDGASGGTVVIFEIDDLVRVITHRHDGEVIQFGMEGRVIATDNPGELTYEVLFDDPGDYCNPNSYSANDLELISKKRGPW
jgi:hypothetical protein